MAQILEKEWQGYFNQLSELEKKSVILMLKTLLIGRTVDETPVTYEQYNKEIDEALENVKAGNYITQEEMEKKATKW